MPPTFQLTMKAGPQVGKIYPLTKGEMIVGRDATADVVIPDAEVSRKHARLFLQGGGYVLEDLGSTNGSFVDGQRLMGPHALRAGETVMFGENISLSFEVVQTDADATVVGTPATLNVPSARASEPATPVFNAPPIPEPVQTYNPPTPEPAPAFIPPTPDPAPAYTPPASNMPADFGAPVSPAAPKKSSSRTWIIAGCGCLVLLLCVCAVAGYYVYSSGMLNQVIK